MGMWILWFDDLIFFARDNEIICHSRFCMIWMYRKWCESVSSECLLFDVSPCTKCTIEVCPLPFCIWSLWYIWKSAPKYLELQISYLEMRSIFIGWSFGYLQITSMVFSLHWRILGTETYLHAINWENFCFFFIYIYKKILIIKLGKRKQHGRFHLLASILLPLVWEWHQSVSS